MAEIEQLAKHPEATLAPLRQMGEAISEGDPIKAYKSLARYQTTLIGGPLYTR